MDKLVLLRIPLLLGLLFTFSACEKEDNKEEGDNATNRWIENTMREYYLWYEDIPNGKKLDYTADPTVFFRSLLSRQDGKDNPQVSGGHYYYSAIKKKASATTRADMSEEPTLGFEFQSWILNSQGTLYGANVLYVLPGSPAEKGGLKRGEWIHRINGKPVDKDNINDLLGTKPVELEVSTSFQNSKVRFVELVPARVEDNPVFLAEVLQNQSTGGKKVGYLVYNHFTAGPGGDGDLTYDNALRWAFARFKAEGVEEFVLDLRYNGGGLVTSAQLLAEMLAPISALGSTFCDLIYNDKMSKTVTYKLEGTEENLNLPQLLVLTGNRTASASEAVVNGLRPYYKVTLLGERTEGKNVGSITLSSDKYDYELHPIVCRIYNAVGFTDYATGFPPQWELLGNDRMVSGELGDYQNDILLKVALKTIVDGHVPVQKPTRSTGFDAIPDYNSLDRKAVNGVRIPVFVSDGI